MMCNMLTTCGSLSALAVICVAGLALAGEETPKSLEEDAALASKIGLAHKSSRWNRFENLHRGSAMRDHFGADTNDNLISSSSSSGGGSQQQEYSCGRALANRKQQEKHSLEGASSRSKYRPLEIRTPRIIGGDETNPGEFPWTVSVKLNGQPICGGSLINRSWILTAAHCVVGYNPKNLTVRLGAYRIKDSNEQQIVESPISLFIVHKQYSMPRPFSNDIALLKMAEPAAYSDFIIPICLPTEDHISTSLVNEIASDYVPKVFTSAGPSSPPVAEDFETSEGIVVSTKMSDKEISRCFKRLEQNYLNSIGLGTSSAGSASEEAAGAPAPSSEPESSHSPPDQRTKNSYLMPPMPVELLPVRVTEQLDAAGRPVKRHHKLSQSDSNSQLGPMFVTTNNENEPHNSLAPGANHLQYETHTITNNNNKISFPAFSDFNNFEQAQASNQYASEADNHNRRANNKQLDASAFNELADSFLMNNQHQVSEHQEFNKYPAYYPSLAWSQHEAMGERRSEMRARAGASSALLPGSEHKQIKLTSLPISKELLREIQSVGSMQSLTLGLQQGDFAAMAEDLNAALGPPSGYAADRERVLTKPAGGLRQVLRDTEMSSNELNTADDLNDTEPTKYSGMTGIVVGWGWVRENDNESEQSTPTGSGQRSYQSVTLQKVRLPILRNSDCEAWFRSQEKKITLLPSQFCAGFNLGGKDACRGDSGGPMIIEDNSDTGRYKLIGIVSAGIGCARPSLPGLYTRVASFLPWIHAQMQHH